MKVFLIQLNAEIYSFWRRRFGNCEFAHNFVAKVSVSIFYKQTNNFDNLLYQIVWVTLMKVFLIRFNAEIYSFWRRRFGICEFAHYFAAKVSVSFFYNQTNNFDNLLSQIVWRDNRFKYAQREWMQSLLTKCRMFSWARDNCVIRWSAKDEKRWNCCCAMKVWYCVADVDRKIFMFEVTKRAFDFISCNRSLLAWGGGECLRWFWTQCSKVCGLHWLCCLKHIMTCSACDMSCVKQSSNCCSFQWLHYSRMSPTFHVLKFGKFYCTFGTFLYIFFNLKCFVFICFEFYHFLALNSIYLLWGHVRFLIDT